MHLGMFFGFGKTPKRVYFLAWGEGTWNGSWEWHFQAQTKVPHCKNLMVTGIKGQIKFFLVCMHQQHRERQNKGRGGEWDRGGRKDKEKEKEGEKRGEMYLFCNSIISLLTWHITQFFRKFQQEPEGLHRAGHAYILLWNITFLTLHSFIL